MIGLSVINILFRLITLEYQYPRNHHIKKFGIRKPLRFDTSKLSGFNGHKTNTVSLAKSKTLLHWQTVFGSCMLLLHGVVVCCCRLITPRYEGNP